MASKILKSVNIRVSALPTKNGRVYENWFVTKMTDMNQHCFCYSEKFEATNNTVVLRLHLAPCYRLENGALQPANKEHNGSTTLSFDRRKTVGDLRLAIYQVMSFPKSQNVVFLDPENNSKNKLYVYIMRICLFRCRNSGKGIWL